MTICGSLFELVMMFGFTISIFPNERGKIYRWNRWSLIILLLQIFCSVAPSFWQFIWVFAVNLIR